MRSKLKDFAKAVGVAERTIRAWFAENCPKQKRGESLDAWKVRALAWRASTRGKPGPIALPGQPPPTHGRATQLLQQRRLELQIEEHEFNLRARRHDFMSRAEVEAEWARRELAVRQVLLQLPPVLVKRCTMAPPELIEEETRTIVHEILEAFAEDGEFTPRSGLVQPGDYAARNGKS